MKQDIYYKGFIHVGCTQPTILTAKMSYSYTGNDLKDGQLVVEGEHYMLYNICKTHDDNCMHCPLSSIEARPIFPTVEEGKEDYKCAECGNIHPADEDCVFGLKINESSIKRNASHIDTTKDWTNDFISHLDAHIDEDTMVSYGDRSSIIDFIKKYMDKKQFQVTRKQPNTNE